MSRTADRQQPLEVEHVTHFILRPSHLELFPWQICVGLHFSFCYQHMWSALLTQSGIMNLIIIV